jgi:hypothetical protein
MRTPRLFSYVVRWDDGAAPNPFHGLCTLVICKPKIRKHARVGDWVVGVGSAGARNGDLRGRVVYAMRVEEAITLAEYDRRAKDEWPHRIPNMSSKDPTARLGDCIYDYSVKPYKQRPGPHNALNIAKDLSGKYALVSRDFYYFGGKARPLPPMLRGICPPGQGHRSAKNEPLVAPFVVWIRSLGLKPGMHGDPDWMRVECAPKKPTPKNRTPSKPTC